MDITPIPMSREVAEKVNFWIERRDPLRAIAQFVESAGYAPAGWVVPAVGPTPEEIDAKVADRVKAEVLAERICIAADLKKRAEEIEFDKDEETGEVRKTNANRAMQIVQDTLLELSNKLLA